MKTIKILLGIIAINLTLLTIIQTGIWPPKVQASETNYSNVNYGLVPLNEDGSINVNINSSAATMDVNLQQLRGKTISMNSEGDRNSLAVNCYGYDGYQWKSMTRR